MWLRALREAASKKTKCSSVRQRHPDREVGPQSRGSRSRDSQAADEDKVRSPRGIPYLSCGGKWIMKRTLFKLAVAAGVLGLYAACSDNQSVAPTSRAPSASPRRDVSTSSNGVGQCM